MVKRTSLKEKKKYNDLLTYTDFTFWAEEKLKKKGS